MPQPRKLHDRYFKQAKAEGFLARSAYKLKEIQDRTDVIRPADAVLDLGCAPGSWLQVAGELVGPAGRVIGIDLQDISANAPHFTPWTWVMQGDVFTTPPAQYLEALGGARQFDAVLSDMAPSTTGHADDLLSARLCRRVLEILPGLLAPGGALVMKILEGAEYAQVLNQTNQLFSEARGFKPKSSRDVSREMFIIATRYRGTAPRSTAPSTPAPRPGWGNS